MEDKEEDGVILEGELKGRKVTKKMLNQLNETR